MTFFRQKQLQLQSDVSILFQITTDLKNKCTEEFKGTSSAAPLAAGAIALVLQAKLV